MGGDGNERSVPIDLTESDAESDVEENLEEEQVEEQEDEYYPGDSDSYDEFEVYHSDPEDAEDAEAEPVEGADVTLPVVTSYDLDLPKGKRVRAKFDREVDTIYRRISGSWRK